MEKNAKFAFKELKVWQKAMLFADKVMDIPASFPSTRKHYRLGKQLESASTSIAMNIAEGKGRFLAPFMNASLF